MRGMASTETSLLHMAYPSQNGARLIPTGIKQPTKENDQRETRKKKRGWARRGRVKRYASGFYIALALTFWASGTYVTFRSPLGKNCIRNMFGIAPTMWANS